MNSMGSSDACGKKGLPSRERNETICPPNHGKFGSKNRLKKVPTGREYGKDHRMTLVMCNTILETQVKSERHLLFARNRQKND